MPASLEERCCEQQEERRNLVEKWKAESGGFANLEWAGRFGSLEGAADAVRCWPEPVAAFQWMVECGR